MQQDLDQNTMMDEALCYVERLIKDPVQALRDDALFSGIAHLGKMAQAREMRAEVLTEQLCRVIWHTQDVHGEPLEATALCEWTESGMRLIQCGVTRPANGIEENRFEHLLRELRSRERQLEELTHHIPCGAHRCADDEKLTLLWMSDSFFSMFGYTRQEVHALFNDKFMNMVHPNDREELKRLLIEQRAAGPDLAFEYRMMHKNGSSVWILDKGRLWDDGDGKKSYCCLLIETSDRKREQEALRLSLERHQVIMDQTTDIIFEWDIINDALHFSTNWEKKFGYEPIRSTISQRIPLSENIHPDDIPVFVKLMRETAAGVPFSETEFRIRNIEGCFFWCRIRATAQFDNSGQPIKAVGVISDITAEKREKELLLEMAQKDALTGLLNKSAIQAQIESRLLYGDGHAQTLLIIDVDHFKLVNDTYGHLCGDTVLSDVAETLKQHFRASDLIGRIGGDEFLVYMPEVASREAAEKKAQQLLEKLHEIRPIKHAQPISCSIGAAMPVPGASDYLSLYYHADQALYYQKSRGKNGVSFYEEQFCGRIHMHDQMHSAVGGAIVSEEMTLVEEQLAQYTFRMLYRSVDLSTAINQLLEIVGRAYHARRAYICEHSPDGMIWEQTFQWIAPGTSPEPECPHRLARTEELEHQMVELRETGFQYCRDTRRLQCAILDAGVCRGLVCFDASSAQRHWTKQQIATLSLISNVLSVFLSKLRQKEQLLLLREEYETQ